MATLSAAGRTGLVLFATLLALMPGAASGGAYTVTQTGVHAPPSAVKGSCGGSGSGHSPVGHSKNDGTRTLW